MAFGTPIWVDTRAPIVGKPGSEPWRKLLIAQDTGGGILGAVRGDIYWGSGRTAEQYAGTMKSQGRYYILLPLEVAERRAQAQGG